MYNVLICDDQPDIVNALKIYLTPEGYNLFEAFTGTQAVEIAKNNDIHLILLDVMMPVMDGITATSKIREFSNAPIILLTAKSETEDKVLGLNVGADDYITKPFDTRELVARVKAVLRRTQGPEEEKTDVLSFPGLTVSLSQYECHYEGHQVEMPPKELEVLYFLASHVNQVFTREQLLEQVWGFDFFGDSRTVDVHIKRLREKLPGCEKYGWMIRTVWGVGYKFEMR